MRSPINLKGLTLGELEDFFLSIGEKKFRGKQLFESIYTRDARSFEAMTTFAKPLREKLASVARLEDLTLVEAQESRSDGTTKFLFGLADGKRIESVLIPPRTAFNGKDAAGEEEQQRLTLCVSTQVGCALDCTFCATASMGMVRTLTAGEIVDQLVQARRISGRKVTNLVYMGMGEPLMNYDPVMNSIDIITAGMGIAAPRITVSTAGWSPKIRQMADENRKVKLAISLHTLDPEARDALMPINKKHPIPELLDAVEYYYRKTKRRVTFEYILFDGWNDSDEDARRLIRLSNRIPSKVNIIPFHSIRFTDPKGLAAELRPASPRRTEEFAQTLRAARVTVFVRSSAGEDIDAACGQLAVRAGRPGKSIRNRPPKPKSLTSSRQVA
jgi:23S rRNA (adenine2503-C2)-methyltransferase